MNYEQIVQLPENTPGQRIKKLRMTAGLSQNQLSRQLGFTSNYFGQVERDQKDLSKNVADAICSYFHVTYGYLYHGLGAGNSPHPAPGSRELVIDLIKSCSEEECRLLEPAVKGLVEGLRAGGWFSSLRPDSPAKHSV